MWFSSARFRNSRPSTIWRRQSWAASPVKASSTATRNRIVGSDSLPLGSRVSFIRLAPPGALAALYRLRDARRQALPSPLQRQPARFELRVGIGIPIRRLLRRDPVDQVGHAILEADARLVAERGP